MVGDLRRYLQRTPVLELAAAVAVAQAALAFVGRLIYGVVLIPIAFPGGFDFFGQGLVSVGGLTFDWLQPADRLLVFGAIAGLAYLAPRRRLASCPHCVATIPVGASVCRSCTREIGS